MTFCPKESERKSRHKRRSMGALVQKNSYYCKRAPEFGRLHDKRHKGHVVHTQFTRITAFGADTKSEMLESFGLIRENALLVYSQTGYSNNLYHIQAISHFHYLARQIRIHRLQR